MPSSSPFFFLNDSITRWARFGCRPCGERRLGPRSRSRNGRFSPSHDPFRPHPSRGQSPFTSWTVGPGGVGPAGPDGPPGALQPATTTATTTTQLRDFNMAPPVGTDTGCRRSLQLAQRSRQRIGGRVVERAVLQSCPERHACAVQPDPHRADLRVEHLGQRGGVEVVPVVELEQQLLLGRKLAQREVQPVPLLIAVELSAGRADHLVERRHLEVDVLALRQLAQVLVQLVARDREQVGAEGRGVAELIAGADKLEERLLREIVGGDLVSAIGLVAEECVDVAEVAFEQLLSGTLVPGAPAFEQLEVRIHVRPAYHRADRELHGGAAAFGATGCSTRRGSARSASRSSCRPTPCSLRWCAPRRSGPAGRAGPNPSYRRGYRG